MGHLTLEAVCWGAALSGRAATVVIVLVVRRRGGASLSVDEGVEAEIRASTQLLLAHRGEVALQEAVDGAWREEEEVALVTVFTSSEENANCTTQLPASRELHILVMV